MEIVNNDAILLKRSSQIDLHLTHHRGSVKEDINGFELCHSISQLIPGDLDDRNVNLFSKVFEKSQHVVKGVPDVELERTVNIDRERVLGSTLKGVVSDVCV